MQCHLREETARDWHCSDAPLLLILIFYFFYKEVAVASFAFRLLRQVFSLCSCFMCYITGKQYFR